MNHFAAAAICCFLLPAVPVLSQTPSAPAAAAVEPAQVVSGAALPQPSMPQPAISQPAGKHGKVPYTGPSNTVTLPATPMLDEEGRQRLDPDGKPMFNPPVQQQRDKQGHPLFDSGGKPVFQTASDRGFDEHGKKLHVVKEKAAKATSLSVKSGVLTVDGLPGKAALNYEIADLKYLYFYAPWIGVAVIAKEPFPGAKEQPHAFDDKSLTITVGEHTFQLTSDDRLLGKKPESAFVLVDRDFKLPSHQPEMGYGAVLKQPYAWPGARPPAERKLAQAPPLPSNLRPTQMLTPCPAGQMRRAARPLLPGETARVEPCVPIDVVQASTH